MNKKIKIAFVCVHNSCRSQMAEALAKSKYQNILEAYSAGTETKPQINQDAVQIIKTIYKIDMEETQHSKLITELPPIDILITMGCNVQCPTLPNKHREDWGLDDPSGESELVFNLTTKLIEEKLDNLVYRLRLNDIKGIDYEES